LKRKGGKDFSSLREREAKRKRLEAKHDEVEDDAGEKPAARDPSEEDEEEEIQAPVLRPARASMPYHLSTLARSAKISEIYQEWKYGLFGADPLKDVEAETIQAWSANPEKHREYQTRQIIGMYVADAIGHGKSMKEAIEHLQSRWDICKNQNIHRLAIVLEFQYLKDIYGDAASSFSCTMSEIHDISHGFAVTPVTRGSYQDRVFRQQQQLQQQYRARARSTSVPVATSPIRASRASNSVAT
jgi:hypothetical protein